MADIFLSTTQLLQEFASTHDSVLVFYSGGKDARATLDLCSRTFKKVVCVFMYLVPGLRTIEEQLDFARQKYKVEILQYPHWSTIACLKHGVYSPNHVSKDHLPNDYTLADIYNLARADTGIQLIANGNKKADSEFRRKNVNAFTRKDVLCPLRDWNKLEVLAYLALHKIPVPRTKSGKTESACGVDLSVPALCQLYDEAPDDFEKVAEWFPYIWAVVKRREFFGIGAAREAKK